MTLTLSWDLLVIIFFAIVITYSFIIGKHESIKIIVSTYIAIVAAQGLGNLLDRATGESQPLLSVLGLSVDFNLLSSTKLILFVLTIIVLAVRGGFEIEYNKETGRILDTILTGVFGFVTAGLLLATLITFVADTSLLDPTMPQDPQMVSIIEQSNLMGAMILYQDVWFVLPAVLLLGIGFLHSQGDPE